MGWLVGNVNIMTIEEIVDVVSKHIINTKSGLVILQGDLIADELLALMEQEKKDTLKELVDYLSDKYWKLWREYTKQYEESPQPQNDDEEMDSNTSHLLGISGGISMVLSHIYDDLKTFLEMDKRNEETKLA